MKLTATNVLKIRPPEGVADYIEWDDDTPGFGVRFRDGGRGTFFIKFFVDGKQGRMSLGKVGQVSFEDAKLAAQRQLAIVKIEKKNPVAERAKERAEAGENFAALIPAFIKELSGGKRNKRDEMFARKPRAPSYIKLVKRSLEVLLKDLHSLNLGDVKRKMVVEQLDEIEEDRGYRMAGAVQAHLSSYYSFCIRKGYEGMNPVAGTERRNSTSRERYHSPHELLLIWRATEEPTHYNRVVRLLLLTAMRRTIFGRLRRSEINKTDHVIEIGIEQGKSKNGQEFILPMSRQVEAMVLDALTLREPSSEFVFHVLPWAREKELLDARIAALNDGEPIAPWVLHDFRRTFRTLGGEICKISDSITDVCIYHVGQAKSGLNGVYNKRTYLDEKREAMQTWADFIDQLVHGKRDFKVVA